MAEASYLGFPLERLKMQVYLEDSTTPPVGGCVCFDRSNATVAKRSSSVKRPSTLASLADVAGVIVDDGRTRNPGPRELSILPVDHGIIRGAQVMTDENCVAGDFLGPIPGSYYLGKCVSGVAIARCIEAVDGSGTPALVTVDLGLGVMNHPDYKNKVLEFRDDFDAKTLAVSAVANALADSQTYLLTGTTAVTAFSDSLNAEAASAGVKAAGVLAMTQTTTNETSLVLNGEPFGIPAGSALYFETRLTVAAITGGTFKIGLGITDVALATHADFMGFVITDATGAITAIFQKGASGEVTVTPSPAAAVTALTYVTLGMLVRNRAAAVGKKDIYFFIDGVQVSYTNNDTDRAEIPDTESLTLIANIETGSGGVLNLDRWLVRNYINGL